MSDLNLLRVAEIQAGIDRLRHAGCTLLAEVFEHELAKVIGEIIESERKAS